MYKCYFHPKATSNQLCRGCKLPVCVACDAREGFCRECAGKRAMVDELKQLRAASLGERRSATTTGRLRMPPRRAASGALAMAGMAPMMAGAPRALSGALARPEAFRQHSTPVPYRGIATPTGELKRPHLKAQPEVIAAAALPAWLAPFLGGLGVALVLLVALGFLLLNHQNRLQFKHKALYQSLTPHEWTTVHQILNTRRVDISELGQSALGARVRFFGTPRHALSGMATFRAQVAGAGHLSSLVLVADGSPVTSTTAVRANSELSFDTSRLSNGTHHLRLIAYAWGNQATETPAIAVKVAN